MQRETAIGNLFPVTSFSDKRLATFRSIESFTNPFCMQVLVSSFVQSFFYLFTKADDSICCSHLLFARGSFAWHVIANHPVFIKSSTKMMSYDWLTDELPLSADWSNLCGSAECIVHLPAFKITITASGSIDICGRALQVANDIPAKGGASWRKAHLLTS